jgi:hypothetical protein
MSGLLELAERCEQATGPDRVLDADICELIDLPLCELPDCLPDVLQQIIDRTRSGSWDQDPDCPFYTASLDAAMTLVPEGWRWIMREAAPDKHNKGERGFFARLETRDFESVTWGKGSDWITDRIAGKDAFCWAATPALALCAAALRARAASPTPNPEDHPQGGNHG